MSYKPYKSVMSDGINFSFIRDDRFKTSKMAVAAFLPLEKDDVAANAILPLLLVSSCKKYPDFTKINEHLADLYGASVSADIEKIGESQVLSFCADFLNDRFAMNKEIISDEISKLLCDMLFDPKVQNSLFSEEDIKQQKRQLIETIDAQYNDKRAFSRQKFVELMFKDERFGVDPLGTKEAVENLSSQRIFEAWQSVLKNARFEILMLGNFNPESSFRTFKQHFDTINRTPKKCDPEFINTVKEIKEHTDYDEISQCKLVMGFRTECKNVDDNVAAMRVMNALLGATPQSKLFLNVREKLSLCYYCASRFDRNKGLISIESGVEKKNIEAATKEILNQLKELQQGNFEDSDLTSIKMSLQNSFKTISDHLSALESFYLNQTFSQNVKTPFEECDLINAITREQVIEAARGLKLDTIYALASR